MSVGEIARSIDPPIDERTVQRDIHWIRRMNEEWWRDNSEIKPRMMRYLKERIDAMREVIREGWLVLYEAKDDLRMRVAGLNVVLGAEKALSEILGFAGLSLIDLEVQEKLQKVESELMEVRRLAHLAESNTIAT